jgi:glyoxylase-like metal-dependent hydrolase (beta-lactamase superfamily II)
MVHVIPKSGFANTYLIEEDESLMAVDVGSIGAAQEVATYCAGILKRSLEDFRFIFATHFHIDHIGGIGTLLKECSPKTRVLFDIHTKGYIEERESLAPMKNWLSGLVPTIRENYTRIGNLSHIVFESLAGVPLPVFKDNGRLQYTDQVSYIDMQGALLSRIGFSDWEAVPTPGHTPDSISLYNEKTQELICGDLILGRHDGMGYLNRFCWDEGLIRDCFDILNNTLCVRTIYPGHGEVIRDNVNAFAKVVLFEGKGGK